MTSTTTTTKRTSQAKATANGTKAKATQPKAKVTKVTACKRCGYRFRTAQVLDHCTSDAACKARQEIRMAEKAAGLDQTIFDAKTVRSQTQQARARLALHKETEAKAS